MPPMRWDPITWLATQADADVTRHVRTVKGTFATGPYQGGAAGSIVIMNHKTGEAFKFLVSRAPEYEQPAIQAREVGKPDRRRDTRRRSNKR